jgi:hypothetical protein
MRRVPDELQDVPLREPHVLDEVPKGIGGMGRLNVDKIQRKFLYRLLERHVGIAAV